MTPRKRWALATVAVVSLLWLVPTTAAGEAAGTDGEPRARAWAVQVAGTTAAPVALAEAVAQAGATPAATATPYAIDGRSPLRATADATAPDDVTTPVSWDDPSGSAHVEGGYAQAHVIGSSAHARAGLSTGAGTGFAVADSLLSWEQQTQLMGSWNDANARVADAVNSAMDTLAPVVAPLGIETPHVEGMSGLGWIDVANIHNGAASAESGASSGFASARSHASAGEVVLLGGFIVVDDVSADALSENIGGADERHATASVGSLRIAGVDFTLDQDGLQLAGNGLPVDLPGAGEPDSVLQQLADAGLTIRTNTVSGTGDLRSATALEITIDGPDGTTLISIGHAEASAATVGAEQLAPPVVAPTADDMPTTPSVLPSATVPDTPVAAAPATDAAPVWSSPPQSVAVGSTPLQDRRLPPATARAVRTAFLLLTASGLLGAALIPVALGSRTSVHQLLHAPRSLR